MPAYAIRPMTAADAEAIAAWRYPAPYAFYDSDADAGDLAELLDPAGWGRRYFAADDAAGELAGLFVFKPAAGGVELGLGLRPDLTGKGLGLGFVQAGVDYAVTVLEAREVTLAVAAFNRRAITVYERAGFREVERYRHQTGGGLHDFVRMRVSPLRPPAP